MNNQEQNNRSNRPASNGGAGSKDEVRDALDSAKQKAGAALSQAQQTVSGVVSDAVGEAKSAASDVVGKATEEAKGAVDEQKARAADGIESVAGALRQTGAQLEAQDQGAIAQYTDAAAEQLERFSDFLHNRNATELLQEVDRFARRQPELFVAGALAGGFLLGRFLKSTGERNRYAESRPYTGQYGSSHSNQYGNQYSNQSRQGGVSGGYGRDFGSTGGQGREGWLSEQGEEYPRANHGAVEDPQPSSGQVTATYPAGERVVAQQTYDAYQTESHLDDEQTKNREGFQRGNGGSSSTQPVPGNDEGKKSPGSAQRDPYQDPGPR